MAKLNIFRKEWLDIVFENRNKNYGAYQLRMENPRTTVMSFFIGIGLFGGVIGSTALFSTVPSTAETEKTVPDYSDVLVFERAPVQKLLKKEEVVEVAESKTKAKTITLKTNTVVFTTPTVVSDKDVANEMLNMNALLQTNTGSRASEGALDGVLDVGEGLIGDKVEDGTNDGVKTVDKGNEILVNVQVKAVPMGGLNKFSSMFISRFRAPEMTAVSEVKVIVSFVVEKDGSLTDIKVLRDPGYGVGVEAIRVLNEMPKWHPAQQNGVSVRSQFTLPITIKIE